MLASKVAADDTGVSSLHVMVNRGVKTIRFPVLDVVIYIVTNNAKILHVAYNVVVIPFLPAKFIPSFTSLSCYKRLKMTNNKR